MQSTKKKDNLLNFRSSCNNFKMLFLSYLIQAIRPQYNKNKREKLNILYLKREKK